MVEHVGDASIDAYGRRLFELVRPGGMLLNHGIARLRHGDPEAGPFSERYVFPTPPRCTCRASSSRSRRPASSR